VEPTVGESLCRLFPPDENIDLRRIAQIARQSLKRRDPSTGKTAPASASATRSTSEISQQPAPPGLTESSSSRSDKLLLGLYDSRTLNEGRTRTTEAAALGSLRRAACNCRTLFTDIRSLLRSHELAKTRIGGMQTDVPITARDTDSEIPISATVQRTFKRTFLLNPAGKLWCCTNSRWGGFVDRTALLYLWDVVRCIDRLNSWSVDLLRKIPHWTSLPSWTLPAFLWTLVKLSVSAVLISAHYLITLST